MKIGVIINPKSAGGDTLKVWRRIKSQALHRLGGLEVIETQAPFEAAGIAQKLCKSGYEIIVIVGGDGTIHEVVNGVLDPNGKPYNPDIRLGVINSGRGCDFIKSLHLPTDPRESLSVIVDNRVRKLDIGRLEIKLGTETQRRLFVNSCSFGLGGEVAHKIGLKKSTKYIPPSVMYLKNSFTSLMKTKYYDFVVKFDDDKELRGPFLNMFVCNGRFSGGGMYWAPQAQVDDGKLDLVVVRKMSKIKASALTHKIYDGSFQTLDEVEHFSVQKVHVISPKAGYIELDGETVKTDEFKVEVLPQVLNFIVP